MAEEVAVFAGGCFWCTEAVFNDVAGVTRVESGYTGGTDANPTYKQVCRGDTNHAEVAQSKFDPAKISFDELLEVFWKVHDPTTLNSQGADHGTQYRSGVYYTSPEQKALAEMIKKELESLHAKPI